MSELKYTQEDMDNISNKIKESQKAKYEKTHIAIDEYKKLEDNYNDLSFKVKKQEFKEKFKKFGGNTDTYEDFILLNKDLVNLEDKDLEVKFNELKENKKHFFNQATQPSGLVTPPSDNSVMSDLLSGKQNGELITGTIYKTVK